jgi:endonuclease III related protein
MISSLDLWDALCTLRYPKNTEDPYWWPSSGTFDVVLGVVLTQNTRWKNVEKSLHRLHMAQLNHLNAIAGTSHEVLAHLIRPSGFFNQKAQRLICLCQNICDEFGDFDLFCHAVNRPWLLSQKGLGPESADSILCYACYRKEMVVDTYTARLLHAFGLTFKGYDSIKTWLKEGFRSDPLRHNKPCKTIMNIVQIYAYLHGGIVEYCKEHSRSKQINIAPLQHALAYL